MRGAQAEACGYQSFLMPRGFSLLDTILALGLLAALFLIGFQADTIMQTVLAGRGARQVESVLGTAALRARSGLNGTNWGVYFAYDNTTRIATQAVLFSGTTYASRDVTRDIVFPFGRSLKFSNVSLSGVAPSSGNDHEIDFTFLTGQTAQYGSITIQSYASTTQIDIPAIGIAVRR